MIPWMASFRSTIVLPVRPEIAWRFVVEHGHVPAPGPVEEGHMVLREPEPAGIVSVVDPGIADGLDPDAIAEDRPDP